MKNKYSRANKWVVAAILVLAFTIAGYAAPLSGWSFVTATGTDQTTCPIVSTNVFCGVVTATSQTQIWVSINGGALVMIYPSTSTAGLTSFNGRTAAAAIPVTNDYSFGMISGNLTGPQLPVKSTCTVTYSNFVSDGKGGGSFTGVNTLCQ